MKVSLPKPKKALGQNFLMDHNYIRKIVEAARLGPSEDVLEIGPGHGLLTRALAEKAACVTAIELDRALFPILQENLSGLQNVRLIQADAMTFDYQKLKGPMKVVANLPYSIATPLIFRLVGLKQMFTRLIVMVQKEVAQRIVAGPGQKSYGRLSISLQCTTDPVMLMKVPRTCFYPRPKVDSAVLGLTVLKKPRWPVTDQSWFLKVLEAGFAHRRKFLHNALVDHRFPPEQVRQAFRRMRLDPKIRAEKLSPQEFCLLADRLFEIHMDLC